MGEWKSEKMNYFFSESENDIMKEGGCKRTDLLIIKDLAIEKHVKRYAGGMNRLDEKVHYAKS